jgi:hypothetical protein
MAVPFDGVRRTVGDVTGRDDAVPGTNDRIAGAFEQGSSRVNPVPGASGCAAGWFDVPPVRRVAGPGRIAMRGNNLTRAANAMIKAPDGSETASARVAEMSEESELS